MSLWTPSQISPHTWIDFSDSATLFDATTGGNVVTNGVGIARAEDKSGNGRNFTQATSGNRPTWRSNRQNGIGAAEFDGGDSLTSISARSVWTFLHNSQNTLFFVNKNGTSTNPGALLGWLGNNGNTSNNIGVVYGYDDRGILTGFEDAFSSLCAAGGGNSSFGSVNFAGNAIVTEFRNVITPNAFGVFCVRADPANATPANRVKLSVNGGSLVGNNERSASTSTSDSTFDLQIGTQGNSTARFLGDYSELLIFNSLLSTTNQQLVEGYLAWKWGTQSLLPSDHPHKNAAPTIGRARRLLNDGLFNRGLFNAGLAR